jgi:thiol-disulfide isomerase/thioredoxin
MSFLIAAVVLLGVLTALNLFLTIGVVKRLREHTGMLADAANPGTAIGAGEPVGEFVSSTVDGESLARADLVGDTLVAFFSTTCEPCEEKLPKFVDFARTLHGGRDQALAVVVGDPSLAAWDVADLTPVARVVVEATDGAVSTAFGVRGYPTVLRVGPGADGQLVVTDDKVRLDVPVPARA